jgi:hypothetical protein
MRLADHIAQSRLPFHVRSAQSHQVVQLNGVADYADQVLRCPTRYVLSDDLTRLCTALAYSRGARSLACADLLHVPAEWVWVEWCEAPWRAELKRYGFRSVEDSVPISGRRGALIRSSVKGRRGQIKTFWTNGLDVIASSMEAYFDFDTPDGEAPDPPDNEATPVITVFDAALRRADILRRCFRFRFERTWADYYARASLSPMQMDAVARHALGTIAIDIPVLLTFLVLLMTRPGIPRRPLMLERLNRARSKAGEAAALAACRGILAALTGLPALRRCRIRHRPTRATPASCSRASGAARQPGIVARTASSRQRTRRHRSLTNGNLDDRFAPGCRSRRQVPCR